MKNKDQQNENSCAKGAYIKETKNEKNSKKTKDSKVNTSKNSTYYKNNNSSENTNYKTSDKEKDKSNKIKMPELKVKGNNKPKTNIKNTTKKLEPSDSVISNNSSNIYQKYNNSINIDENKKEKEGSEKTFRRDNLSAGLEEANFF